MCTRHGRCARAWVGGMAHTKMVGFLHPLEAGVSQHAILQYCIPMNMPSAVQYIIAIYVIAVACTGCLGLVFWETMSSDVMLRFLVRCLAMSLLSSVLANAKTQIW